MKTNFRSEAEWHGFDLNDLFYIKYEYLNQADWIRQEFWTDDEEEYEKRLGFVLRHIGSYRLIYKRPPLNNDFHWEPPPIC